MARLHIVQTRVSAQQPRPSLVRSGPHRGAIATSRAIKAIAPRVIAFIRRLNGLSRRLDAMGPRGIRFTRRLGAMSRPMKSITPRVIAMSQRLNALSRRLRPIAPWVDRFCTISHRVEPRARRDHRSVDRDQPSAQPVEPSAQPFERPAPPAKPSAHRDHTTVDPLCSPAHRRQLLTCRVTSASSGVGGRRSRCLRARGAHVARTAVVSDAFTRVAATERRHEDGGEQGSSQDRSHAAAS